MIPGARGRFMVWLEDGVEEPVFHSYITDALPVSHAWATETVDCEACGVMVHAFNNECMQPWMETGAGPYCFPCFVALWNDVHDAR